MALLGLSASPALAQTAPALPAGVSRVAAVEGITDRLEAAYRAELERLNKDGVTADELKAAKAAALQSFQVERSQDDQLARKWA